MNVPSGLEIQHAELVDRLGKPGADIIKDLHPHSAELLHYAFALVLEAAELGDIVKKTVIYNKEFGPEQLANAIEELGDIEFYLQGIRRLLLISRAETLEGNINKLTVRYGSSYSNEAAQARADKVAQETQDFHRE